MRSSLSYWIALVSIETLAQIKLSANWMAAAGHPGEDAKLFDAVKAVGLELCPELDLSIPVGKDSLSMQAQWSSGTTAHKTVSPVSLIVTAFAPVRDARRDEQQVRGAIDVTHTFGVDLLIRQIRKRNHQALGPTRDSARHVQGGCSRRSPRQHEGGQGLQPLVERIDLGLHAGRLAGGDPQRSMPGRQFVNRRCKIGAQVEQVVLHVAEHLVDIGMELTQMHARRADD